MSPRDRPRCAPCGANIQKKAPDPRSDREVVRLLRGCLRLRGPDCTVTRGLDRDDDGAGPRPGNLLLQTILPLRSRFEDLFRSLWPTAHGWTRAGARLDYALLRAPTTAVKLSCEVTDDFDSDHAGVTFAIQLPDNAGLHQLGPR